MNKVRLSLTLQDLDEIILTALDMYLSDIEQSLIEIDELPLRQSLKAERADAERVKLYLLDRIAKYDEAIG
jgi:hypothetical protein